MKLTSTGILTGEGGWGESMQRTDRERERRSKSALGIVRKITNKPLKKKGDQPDVNQGKYSLFSVPCGDTIQTRSHAFLKRGGAKP